MNRVLKVIGGSLIAASVVVGSAKLVGSNRKLNKVEQENTQLKAKIDSLNHDIFQLKLEKEYASQIDSIKHVPSSEWTEGFAARLVENAKKLGKFRGRLVIEKLR